MDLNPNSFRRMVSTLLAVNGRGYWETSDENLEKLQELYQEHVSASCQPFESGKRQWRVVVSKRD
nr:hypothetical protein [Nodosilinea sp. LEGE 07088]